MKYTDSVTKYLYNRKEISSVSFRLSFVLRMKKKKKVENEKEKEKVGFEFT